MFIFFYSKNPYASVPPFPPGLLDPPAPSAAYASPGAYGPAPPAAYAPAPPAPPLPALGSTKQCSFRDSTEIKFPSYFIY